MSERGPAPAGSPAPAATATRPVLALSTTMTAQILGSLCLAVPPVVAPVVAPELGFGPERVGLFVGIAYFVAMLSGLASGAGVRRFGAIGVTQWAMLTFAIGMALLPLGTAAALVASAVVIGIGYGILNPSAAPLLQFHSPPNHRALYFSIKQAAVPIGIALAGLLMPPALTSLGWRMAVEGLAIVCGLYLLVLLPARPLLQRASGRPGVPCDPASTSTASTDSAPARISRNGIEPASAPIPTSRDATDGRRRHWLSPLRGSTLARVLRDPPLRRVALASFAYAFSQLAYTTFLVSYLKLELGQTLALAAGILAISQVASTLARIGWGAVADNWIAPDRLLGWLGIGSALAFVALGLLGQARLDDSAVPVAWVLFASLLCAITSMSWNGVYFAELARLTTPTTLAATAGAAQFLTFCGSMTGPVLFSQLLAAGTGYGLTYALMMVLPLTAGLSLLYHSRRRDSRR